MSLRLALLATLSAGPRTGYELLQAFDSSVGYVWHAPHTQIYPQLRRMEAEGLLRSRELPRGQRGTKRSYAITDDGRAELRRLTSDAPRPSLEKDPYRLRAAYLEWATRDGARAAFEAHIAHFAEWIERWEGQAAAIRDRESAVLRDRLAIMPAEQHSEIMAWKVFAYEGLIERAQMEIAWARRGLELLDELKPSQRAQRA